jgi:hypothetical protein
VQLTARHIARHGLPKRSDIVVKSPYSGRICHVIAAQECGSAHVVLTIESGVTLFVDARQKVDKVKRLSKQEK